ncbi:phosphoribosylglycinamide formyltransferase [Fictibacillus sp. Mic-4]|uniref:phosphoribosylglycinamide formyltransferase n=1 Tax=Fictibacillus TaxID=1329200 RepID=UPI0004038B96|nr:phosphoribosylglycinamide formyltransferase [Fictibacillus gelatini]
MRNIAIFASGSGSNFQAIVDSVKEKKLNVHIALMVCDKPGAFVIERAEKEGIDTFVFHPKNYESKAHFERDIIERLYEKNVDFIALAGYMRLIGPTLLDAFEGRIVNIHPSLLPAFPGKDAIGQALEAGADETGVTIHYVDSGMDTGPIIKQEKVEILPEDTREALQERIQKVEHTLYPSVLKELVGGVRL